MEQSFLLNQNSTKQGGYTLFGHQLQKNDGIDPIKREEFKLLEAFCIFGYQECWLRYCLVEQQTIDKSCSNLLMVYINQQGKGGRRCLTPKPWSDLLRSLHIGTHGTCE
jgi:hypothetical protein